MNRIITGQVLMVLCCMVYLIWWYRGFRPGIDVSRVGGVNGFLLLITAGLGIAGIVMSLTPVSPVSKMKADPLMIAVGGAAAYIVLLLVTKICFHRVVTTELILIVGKKNGRWNRTFAEVTALIDGGKTAVELLPVYDDEGKPADDGRIVITSLYKKT